MIERAPGFEIGALISESGSLFNHFAVAVQVRRDGASLRSDAFMSFMFFMSFLFRLLRNRPPRGIQRGAHAHNAYFAGGGA